MIIKFYGHSYERMILISTKFYFSGQEFEIFASNSSHRGGYRLRHNGYLYFEYRRDKTKPFRNWYCSFYQKAGQSKCHTRATLNNNKLVLTAPHNH